MQRGWETASMAMESDPSVIFAATARLLCALAVLLLACALGGCGGGAPASQQSQPSAAGASSSASGPTTSQLADFRDADLGCGWEPERSMELVYAQCFTVDYFADGYKLACLSDGGRYLVVPQGKAAPEGLAEDIVVLQQPLANVYLVASDTMCLFDALDALGTIGISGTKQEDWSIPAAAQAMEEGSIVYGGKYSSPDYELILSKECGLAIESTMINHTPQVKDKLEELGIPVLVEQSSYEAEPLGRTEWVKLYGALLDEEDAAQAVFDEQVERAKAVEGAGTGKTVAFFYINSNGVAVARKPGDYVTKMIGLAGGEYIFDTLDDSGTATSTVTLEMEKFYEMAKDADVVIYNATIDGGVSSVADLVGKNSLLGKFKAVQDGQVWCTDQNMYQNMVKTGEIIAGFNSALTGGDGGEYLRRLE